jgi:hypothetical protein
MVVIAVAVDGALSAFDKKLLGSYARQLIAVSIVFLGFLPMLDAAKTRQTNSDLIAAQLQVSANPGDFILVIPWYYGVSFDRYYTGATPWMTLPIISDHKTHRYDLSKEQMVLKEPLVSIIDAMTNTLKSGNRIYLVGSTIVPPIGKLLTLKPAPSDKHGWNEGAYSYSWMTQVGYFLQNRVTKVEKFNLPDVFHISPYENMGLMVVQGWKKQ